MNLDDSTKSEEQFDRWLAAGDDALAAGVADMPSCLEAAPSDIRSRLQLELAWCQHVRELWPQVATSTRLEQSATVRIPAAPKPTPAGSRLGRFQIRRELGRGGFGVVFLAYDPRLEREVALKVPRETALVSMQLRERFKQEVRVAANLDHPHIVQVFEAGEEGGICYIASAYCPGVDLAAWLGRHTLAVPANEAAELIATLAGAMAHAHVRGILHRDLKPGNILLQSVVHSQQQSIVSSQKSVVSRSNESAPAELIVPPTDYGLPTIDYSTLADFIPKIADFGLAKLLEDQATSPTLNNPTRSGAIIGTPAYMAPEQAAGNQEAVGPATDIFALGAILYEVLTGRPPFQGETNLDILLQVRTADPVPPRKLRPKLPRDLETICLKCLDKEPSSRYASACDLSLDLRRFLAHEPILARPASPIERSWKWARRRPALAALAGVSLASGIALFTVIGVSNIMLKKERDIADGQRREANLQRQRAVVHLQEACDAVDRLTQVGFETLGAVPYMETMRRDLLHDAVRLYQGLVREENDDPDLRYEAGRAWRRLGKIQQDLGENKAAEDSFRAALAIQSQLRVEFPERSAFREELGACHNNLSNFLWQVHGNSDEAYQAVLDAIQLQEELASEFSEAVRHRRNLAESYDELGRVLVDRKQIKEAEDAFRRAVEVLERVVAEAPADQSHALSLASRRRNLAVFLANQNRLKEAEPLFRDDLQFWQTQEAESPTDPRLLGRAADASKHLGLLLLTSGNPAEGETLLRGAIERWQRLADQYPRLPTNHENLAAAKEKLARHRRAQNEFLLACPLLTQAIAHWQTCNKLRPPTQEQRVLLGSLHWLLADSEIQVGAHRSAADGAEKLHAICFDRWQEHYQAARLLTRCVRLTKKDIQLSESAKRDVVEKYAHRSVEMLHEAFRLGYNDLAFVEKDPGLDVLREREDFKQLLREQGTKSPKSSANR